jgi:hypothetical protein
MESSQVRDSTRSCFCSNSTCREGVRLNQRQRRTVEGRASLSSSQVQAASKLTIESNPSVYPIDDERLALVDVGLARAGLLGE